MKLPMAVRYALRMMVDIAKESNGQKRVNLNQVAQHTTMPRRFLEQLAIPLRKASLVQATTGRGGGYTLAKPAEEIKLGNIVEAVAGRINLVDCIPDPTVCQLAPNCKTRPLYLLVSRRINDTLNEYSLADILEDDWPERVTAEIARC